MALSHLRASVDFSRGGYRAPDRRQPDVFAEAPPAPPAEPEPPAAVLPLDVAFHASRFRAGLSQLIPPDEAPPSDAGPAEAQGDPELFDFFGNLNVLLLAVRAGDLPRAQAAADALEMEMLVERSAGRRGGELSELARLVGAVRERDDTAVRAAVRSLAPESWRDPPTDLYGEPEAGGAAYDTLAQYFDEDARVV